MKQDAPAKEYRPDEPPTGATRETRYNPEIAQASRSDPLRRRVLFVGDVNVDFIMGGLQSLPVVDREVTCSSFRQTLGSSVVITAANFAGLGGDAAVAGLAGDDALGRYMIDGMRARGIATDLVDLSSDVSTGVTVNLIHGSSRTQITYPGTIATFSETARIEKSLPQFDHVHFSGLYQQHAFRPKLTALLDAARANGVTTSIDTQWDPVETWEYLDDWLPRLDYFFVNEDEARSITRSDSGESAFANLRDRTSMPICKLGRRGALIAVGGDAGASEFLPPYPVDVVDTTGAGDAFAAGFLFGRIEKGLDPLHSARLANAAAARNCTEAGGVNSCPSYEEIIKFMESYSEPQGKLV